MSRPSATRRRSAGRAVARALRHDDRPSWTPASRDHVGSSGTRSSGISVGSPGSTASSTSATVTSGDVVGDAADRRRAASPGRARRRRRRAPRAPARVGHSTTALNRYPCRVSRCAVPTIFVVPAAFTLNSPGSTRRARPRPRRDAERRAARPRAARRAGRTAPGTPSGLRVAGDEVEHERALVVGGEPAAGGPDHRGEAVRQAASRPREAAASASIRLNAAVGSGLCTRSRPSDLGEGEGGEQLGRQLHVALRVGRVESRTSATGPSPNGPVTRRAGTP